MNWSSINSRLSRAKEKYRYYEGDYSYYDLETSRIAKKVPRQRVGWGARAVDIRSNKTVFDCFENDELGLNNIFSEYRVPAAFDKLKADILVGGVGFLALAGDRVLPFNCLEATGTYNWYEQNLKTGVAVFQESSKQYSQSNQPDSYISYSKDATSIVDGDSEDQRKNITSRPLIALLTYRSSTKRPFGRSVLSSTARHAIVDASRTLRQSSIAAYHYNKKVDVILGVDVETEVNKIEGQTGDIVKIGPNSNGQIPTVSQFAQHAMAPFKDSFMLSAQNFCTETKLSLSNLGYASNAPDSPEALEIIGDDLRDDITNWQEELGEQLKYFAVTLWMHKHGVTEIDESLRAKIDATSVAWRPVFRTDIGKFGDGLNKMVANAPAIARQRSIWRKAGLTSREIDDVIADYENNQKDFS